MRGKIFVVFVLLLLFLFPRFLFGEEYLATQKTPEILYPTLPGVPFPKIAPPYEKVLMNYIKYVFNFLIFLGILIAFVLLIISGFRYFYSMGNPQIQASARDQIQKAFLGILLLLLSYHVLAMLSPDLVIVNPPILTSMRLFVNLLKRPPGKPAPVTQVLTLPLEFLYPEIKGFRPEVISFTSTIPYYPINLLIEKYINYIYDWSVIIAVVVAFLVIVVATFKYLIGGLSPTMLQEAKDQIFSALLGLLLLLISFYILKALHPTFVLIHPTELPEPEIEVPEGVYFCDQEAPIFNDKRDLFEQYIINQVRKRMGLEPPQEEKLDKWLMRELALFVDLRCIRIDASVASAPPEISGRELEFNVDEEIQKIADNIPGLTKEELEKIRTELEESKRTQYSIHKIVYFNGDYGIALHEKKDFEGWADIILSASHLLEYFPTDFYPFKIDSDFYPKWTLDLPITKPASITVFENKILKCQIEEMKKASKSHSRSMHDLSECLFGQKAPENRDELEKYMENYLMVSFFSKPEFGALEEKPTATQTIPLYVFANNVLKPVVGPRVPLKSFVELDHPEGCIPCYSIKLPEGNWILFVSDGERVVVFDTSQRDLTATPVRGFSCDSSSNEPCVTRIMILPGAILKPISR
jgi:hypothetical protein